MVTYQKASVLCVINQAHWLKRNILSGHSRGRAGGTCRNSYISSQKWHISPLLIILWPELVTWPLLTARVGRWPSLMPRRRGALEGSATSVVRVLWPASIFPSPCSLFTGGKPIHQTLWWAEGMQGLPRATPWVREKPDKNSPLPHSSSPPPCFLRPSQTEAPSKPTEPRLPGESMHLKL